MVVTCIACVPNLTSPARTTGAYTEKAVSSAAAARSAVETVRVALGAADGGDAFLTTLEVTVSDAERSLGDVTSVFSSVLPPNRASDLLRAELVGLLDDATDVVAQSRIALRRHHVRALPALIDELRGVARDLAEFDRAHG